MVDSHGCRIGTDPPKEVPKEEFERLEEKLEELKKEAAEDLADDGSVDSELEEQIKELQETLTEVVPVEQGPPSGLRLLSAAARAVRIFVAAPRVAVRGNGKRRERRTARTHLSAILDAFQTPPTRVRHARLYARLVISKKPPTCRQMTRANPTSSGSARWS